MFQRKEDGGSLRYLLSRLHGNPEGAMKSLTKEVEVLRITYGTRTPFMKELIMQLEEARAEASYKLASKDD